GEWAAPLGADTAAQHRKERDGALPPIARRRIRQRSGRSSSGIARCDTCNSPTATGCQSTALPGVVRGLWPAISASALCEQTFDGSAVAARHVKAPSPERVVRTIAGPISPTTTSARPGGCDLHRLCARSKVTYRNVAGSPVYFFGE